MPCGVHCSTLHSPLLLSCSNLQKVFCVHTGPLSAKNATQCKKCHFTLNLVRPLHFFPSDCKKLLTIIFYFQHPSQIWGGITTISGQSSQTKFMKPHSWKFIQWSLISHRIFNSPVSDAWVEAKYFRIRTFHLSVQHIFTFASIAGFHAMVILIRDDLKTPLTELVTLVQLYWFS